MGLPVYICTALLFDALWRMHRIASHSSQLVFSRKKLTFLVVAMTLLDISFILPAIYVSNIPVYLECQIAGLCMVFSSDLILVYNFYEIASIQLGFLDPLLDRTIGSSTTNQESDSRSSVSV